jgi:hypothetical protein
MTGKLLHQLPLCAEWWVTECYCIRYRCVRSDEWQSVTAWDIAVCGVMSGTLLLHQSSLCVEWCPVLYYCILQCVRSNNWCTITAWVITCAEWWQVLYCCISQQCVRTEKRCTVTAPDSSVWGEDRCIVAVSVISVCRLMTDALSLHQSSMCADKWLVHHFWISHQCAPNWLVNY